MLQFMGSQRSDMTERLNLTELKQSFGFFWWTSGKESTLVQSLGWEDPLEEGMAIHSSIHAWRIPMDRGA